MKSLTFIAERHASAPAAGLLVPLPRSVDRPVPISLEAWLELLIDDRAPVRSVALVELLRDRFLVLVVDTVAQQPRWLITGRRDQLASVYDGMGAGVGMHARGTTAISVPALGATLRASRPAVRRTGDMMAVPANDTPDDDTEPCVLCGTEQPTKDPSGGPGGQPELLALVAEFIAEVAARIQHASPVRVSGALGETFHALVFPAARQL